MKKLTVNLFNKKDVDFDLATRPYGTSGTHKQIRVRIKSTKSMTVGEYLAFELSYFTNANDVFISVETGLADRVTKQMPREESVVFFRNFLKTLPPNKAYSRYNTDIDFYKLIGQFGYEVFEMQDFFELNYWKQSLYLKDHLSRAFPQHNLRFAPIEDAYHIHGGVGTAKNHDDLHTKTLSVEIGTSPILKKRFLAVTKSLNENTTYPAGLYPDGTTEMFLQAVLEQYKGAWNREGIKERKTTKTLLKPVIIYELQRDLLYSSVS